MKALAAPAGRQSRQVPAPQRAAASRGRISRAGWLKAHGGQRAEALRAAYLASWKTMPGLADECGLSVALVGRMIRSAGTAGVK